ncbi:hypothetical protein CERSUDRAFT_107483 [Gelatoporia subvermispora B]|uniref:Cytochrome P450 n=1 Tax=Ceriporiopsis subvermispora (strain B) TaxID=914234 RepID=M2R5S9_CERS8|nr:hypothetical protein CERSUDRAFT_107483 [Gelatoporia subvermispora B]
MPVITRTAVHYAFKRCEPRAPLVHLSLLGVPPSLLSVLVRAYYSNLDALIVSYGLFLTVLLISVVLYRVSPFHPLASYPGPLLLKVTRLSFAVIGLQGRQHRYIQKLHREYGDIVRIGLNEISINSAAAITPVLGTFGFHKSQSYIGRGLDLRKSESSLLASSGEDHAAKRKPWSRAFSTPALKGYEDVISRRAKQLVGVIAKEHEVDLGVLLSWFTFDFMGDMAFGGGPNLLEKGDKRSVWSVMEAGMAQGHFFANVPWISVYARHLPMFGKDVRRSQHYARDRAARRVKEGSLVKDLVYYLNNEDGAEKQSPQLHDVVREAVLAIVAGSDTTSGVLANMFFFLLRDPKAYARLQAEIDQFYSPGKNALDTKHHQDMPILNAAINETLRLMPAVLSGSERVAPAGGKVVAQQYPEGTRTYLHLFSMQRDARNFAPNPESYWLDRWLIASGRMTASDAGIDGRSFVHNREAFIPFSFGRANCVGKNLALQEMRMTTCLIMQRLELQFALGYDPESYLPGLRDFFVTKKPPLFVSVKVRDKASA